MQPKILQHNPGWYSEVVTHSRLTAPIIVLIIFTGFDLITKDIAQTYWKGTPGISVINNYCRFEYDKNYEAVFRIGESVPHDIKKPVNIICGTFCLLFVLWIAFHYQLSQLGLWGSAIIGSGLIGNVGDRIFYGYVVDFIHVQFGSFHWYPFNLADIYVYGGLVVVLIDLYLQRSKRKLIESEP